MQAPAASALGGFADATRAWFDAAFDDATAPQVAAWPHIGAGRHTLIAAPTGSGKTLAAFLSAIDDLVRRALDGTLTDETHVVYVSPLKALGNDVEKNLQQPLDGILARAGLPSGTITTAVRSGDTSARDRRLQVRNPAHIFVTTPESLYILLTSESGRKMLGTVRTVIVDEIHAVVGDKRGSHLALSIERLEALVGGELQRIGLSATQRPIDDVARFLVGSRETPEGEPDCVVVDTGHRRAMDLRVEVPESPLSAVMSTEVWTEVHRRLADLIEAHRTTLVFVNTRRLAERLTAYLEELVGADAVMSHHGSLSRKHRLLAEQRLKRGELKALVATASLELGIDIGEVDLVCQIGSTRTIASLLQRVGRSGHSVGLVPKGRIFPLTRDELVECAALVRAVREDQLDRLVIPERPVDILAQQVVAEVAASERSEEELLAMVRGAHPFRDLTREELDEILEMLSEGFTTRRGRRAALVHHDAVNGMVRGRRGARLTAITSGGAIPDVADYDVVLESTGNRVGSLDEDFAIESMVGDVFQLGNNSWQVLKVEPGKVFVRDAAGMPPTIPFWFGEAPPRSAELSAAVSQVRGGVAEAAEQGGVDGAVAWLMETCGLERPAAQQAADYLVAGANALGAMPTQDCVIVERFFDESGGMQLVVHSPFGARLNRAWGLALRKRFCRRFNFELQAAATEDAIVLSLGVTHSFPLEEVFEYLSPESVRHVLIQALLDAPMFGTRWRWNANRALAVPRFRGGRKVPAAIQRMNAEDLVSVVFPDQIACLENIAGEREVPDHPLVRQTIRDCLEEAMDIDALEVLLARLESGDLRTHGRDLTEPSPLAAEILNAAPYAFLDDAPLEERRTNAVRGRRWIEPGSADEIGRVDPAAIAEVRASAWPTVRDPDELHDALVVTGVLSPDLDAVPLDPEAGDGSESSADGADDASRLLDGLRGPYGEWFDALVAAGRAVEFGHAGAARWVAVERLHEVRTALGGPSIAEHVVLPERFVRQASKDRAAVELVRGRLEASGPIGAEAIATLTGLERSAVDHALLALEGEGFVMRGAWERAPDGSAGNREQWCERRLLARIHRSSLDRLRARVRAVPPSAYVRFALGLQRVTAESRVEGIDGLMGVIEQLQGVSAPAAAWEAHILPARVSDYDPSMLDMLCLSGRVAWARARRAGGGAGPVRTTPIVLAPRDQIHLWTAPPEGEPDGLSREAARLLATLRECGAEFVAELARRSRLLPSQVEEALGELVAAGLVVSDGFAGLRALIAPASLKRRSRRGGGKAPAPSVADGGRWAVAAEPPPPSAAHAEFAELYGIDPRAPAVVDTLLARYGVLFRAALARGEDLPPWRDLLRVLRRMEARGEVRGGRFVSGFSGEQYARPDVVTALRRARTSDDTPELVSLSAVDPANPLGNVLRKDRVTYLAGNRVLMVDGDALAILESNEVRFVASVEDARRWEMETALVRVATPPSVRRYLGNGSARSPRSPSPRPA